MTWLCEASPGALLQFNTNAMPFVWTNYGCSPGDIGTLVHIVVHARNPARSTGAMDLCYVVNGCLVELRTYALDTHITVIG